MIIADKEKRQCARSVENLSPKRILVTRKRGMLEPSHHDGVQAMRLFKFLSSLTVGGRGRMIRPIGGKNPPWGRRNSLFLTVSRHVSNGYFCARNPGAILRLWREGGEYKTLRGNKPACLRTGFYPPATSAVVESLIGGVVKRRPEGFDMTDHDNAGTLPATLTFQDTELSIINHDGAEWFASPDIARALGYPRSDEIGRIFRRNKDEFTEAMTQTAKLALRGQVAPRPVRLFSLRGAHLLSMFATTDRAKAFRRWVLDVLEAQTAVTSADAETRTAAPSIAHMQVVNDVVTIIMNKIGPQIAARPPRTMPPLTRPDDPMPRLMDGHAVFRIGSKMVIVDTQDYDLMPGDRAVVLQVEDGEFPKVVTVQGKPPVKGWFDRCMIFDCGVNWLIPVGAVLGRVVWEGECRG